MLVTDIFLRRTWECVQTFTADNGLQGLSSFCFIGSQDNIIAGAKKIYSFQYDRPGKPWLTNNEAIAAVVYNDMTGTILTAAGRDIRIWDAAKGTLFRSFPSIQDEK